MKYLRDGWLILVLGLVFASGLTAIQLTLQPIIEKNEMDKTYRRIPVLTLGAASLDGLTVDPAAPEIRLCKAGEPVDTLRVEETAKGAALKAYRVYQGDEVVGYVVRSSGPGYADKIDMLIGLSADGKTITGVSVIKQMETPNLGSKIVGAWADQYAGKATAPALEVVKNKSAAADNNKIDAISGATISSDSVTKIVNATVRQFEKDKASLEWRADDAPGDDESAKEDEHGQS